MITVSITRNRRGYMSALEVSGHAGWGMYGEDIVCAGVSALVQGAVLGLEDYLGIRPGVTMGPGYLRCLLKDADAARVETRAIMETMLLGLGEISRQYPEEVRIQKNQVSGQRGRR